MPSIIYHKTEDGKWIKQTFPDQCHQKMLLFGMCQGADGHSGEHWSYSQDGSYQWHLNMEEMEYEEYDAVAGTIPPGHDKYISPEKMIDKQFMTLNVVEDVTDLELIKKLENEEDMGEEVGVTRPVSEEDMERFGLNS